MIKNKKRKLRNYSIIGTSGIVGLATAEGIFYGIPSVTKIVPGWAIALAIVFIMIIAMLFTFLLLAYIANIRDAELRRQLKLEQAVANNDRLAKANGLPGNLPSESAAELKKRQEALNRDIYDKSQHEKITEKLSKKF